MSTKRPVSKAKNMNTKCVKSIVTITFKFGLYIENVMALFIMPCKCQGCVDHIQSLSCIV